MTKKITVVDEIGVEQEVPVVEEVTTAPTISTYPRIPKDEGVDPLTAGPAIANTEPNNQA